MCLEMCRVSLKGRVFQRQRGRPRWQGQAEMPRSTPGKLGTAQGVKGPGGRDNGPWGIFRGRSSEAGQGPKKQKGRLRNLGAV